MDGFSSFPFQLEVDFKVPPKKNVGMVVCISVETSLRCQVFRLGIGINLFVD